jgi:hypothetical protein
LRNFELSNIKTYFKIKIIFSEKNFIVKPIIQGCKKKIESRRMEPNIVEIDRVLKIESQADVYSS